jgi:type I restriction-modification system DNA methylase subunit
MARSSKTSQKKNNGANVGYEAQLWQMADALRGSMDAAEYKHVVLGLIFLKYISDAFERVQTAGGSYADGPVHHPDESLSLDQHASVDMGSGQRCSFTR